MEFIWLIGFVVLLMVLIGRALLHAYQLGARGEYQRGVDATELRYLKREEAMRRQLSQGRIVRGYFD